MNNEESEEIMRIAESVLRPDIPEVESQIGLIMEVFRIMVEQPYYVGRLFSLLPPAPEYGVLNDIATIICATYAELHDDAEITDDEALRLIRDLLLKYDGEILDGNRRRSWKTIEKSLKKDDHPRLARLARNYPESMG